MSYDINLKLWDERACHVGEGPVAIGPNNAEILWVDIYGKKVHRRNLETGKTSSYEMPEEVSFVIPAVDGSELLGTANGPVRRLPDGSIEKLPTRFDADGVNASFPNRWNDAKVAPDGHLFLGSMPYDWSQHPNACGLYRLDKTGKELTRVLDGVWLSNGLGWSKDGKTMFYIDTMAKSIDTFDYADGQISNRKVRWRLTDDSQGLPDGMCVDAEDGIWVAFWNGSCLRRFDKDFNITDVIEMPVPMVTSCAFVGPDFKQMVITSAHDGVANPGKDWGKTYICTPKVSGVAPTLFPN
jgi:sugar lactone lactonase YvrE